jgi:hypothetical protein
VCLNSGYYYNQQPDYDFWISWDTFPTPPCGPGYYANLSESYVNAGFWIGGSVFAKLPARIPVAGKNGTITGYTSLHLAPTLTPAQAARATRTRHAAGIHVGGIPHLRADPARQRSLGELAELGDPGSGVGQARACGASPARPPPAGCESCLP